MINNINIKEIVEDTEDFKPNINREVKSINIKDFLALEIPPREMLLAPIIPSQGLAMLYALRGVGKTQVSLSIALAVASGGKMFGDKWKCDKPYNVLFVDGEMPANTLQERLSSLILNCKNFPKENLEIITPDLQENGIPNLSEKEGQALIEAHIKEDTKLIILDNISTLCRSGKENDEDSWKSIQEWVLRLRSKGKSVLFIHHSNKGGTQRGTSKKEDILDTVVMLKRPNDYENNQGARFEIHYEKARGFYGDDAKPFEASLKDGKWSVTEIEDAEMKKVVELKKDGLTHRDIGEELGISASKVTRILKKPEAKEIMK